MTTETMGIEVSHLEAIGAARFLERAVLLAVEREDLTSAFLLLTKFQSVVLTFLLTSQASEPNYEIGFQRQEYLSILSRIDKAISEVIS